MVIDTNKKGIYVYFRLKRSDQLRTKPAKNNIGFSEMLVMKSK